MTYPGTVVVLVLIGVPLSLFAEDRKPAIVEAVAIEGNRVLSSGDLKLLMHTRASPWYGILPGARKRRYDPIVFRADVDRISAHYADLGYFEAVLDTVVDRRRPGFVRIRIRIDEGLPVVVSDVRLQLLPAGAGRDSVRLMKALTTRPDRPLTRVSRETDLKLIADRLQDEGYAFAQVVTRVTRRGNLADVSFRVTRGPLCRFGEVRIEGNRMVSEGLILRGLTFREGDAFRKKDLVNSRLQLYRSGAFRSVSIGVPDTVARTSPVAVTAHVRERPARTLKLGAGFDTDERLRGLLAWRQRNFLGGGARQLSLESSASALEARAMIGVRQPYVLGCRTGLEVTGFVEQEKPEEVRVKRGGASAALERTFRATGRVVFQVRTDVVDFALDSTRTTISLEYLEDRRDDFFDPQRGMLAEFAARATGDRGFLKISGEGRWYRKAFWKTVLALRISGGLILTHGTVASVPNFERFFAGGARSVRGWRLNRLGPLGPDDVPEGGRSLLEGSVEMRTRLMPGLGVAVFMDAGNVGSDRFEAFVPSGLRLAAGWGVRYLNPISPVRIDVAYRLSEDRSAPRRQVYFSIGQAF